MTLGRGHADTLFSISNLATAYREAGRFADAMPLYQEALERRRAMLGPDHPDTLISMNNLANLYRELGRFSESIALQSEAMRRQEATLGPDHPDTLLSMSNLALAYQDAGRVADAAPLFAEALQRRKAKLGPDHPETLVSMSNLAGRYQAAGRTAEALPLFEETLKRRRATRGPDHPQTLRSMNALARAYLGRPPRPGRADPAQGAGDPRKKLADDWRTFEAEASWAGACWARRSSPRPSPLAPGLRRDEGTRGEDPGARPESRAGSHRADHPAVRILWEGLRRRGMAEEARESRLIQPAGSRSAGSSQSAPSRRWGRRPLALCVPRRGPSSPRAATPGT